MATWIWVDNGLLHGTIERYPTVPSHYLNQCWLIESNVLSGNIYLRAISQEIPQPSVTKIRLKITYQHFHSNPSGVNELMYSSLLSVNMDAAQYLFSGTSHFVPPYSLEVGWTHIFIYKLLRWINARTVLCKKENVIGYDQDQVIVSSSLRSSRSRTRLRFLFSIIWNVT